MSTLFFRAGARALENPNEVFGGATGPARAWVARLRSAAGEAAPVLDGGAPLEPPDLGGLLDAPAATVPEEEERGPGGSTSEPAWLGRDLVAEATRPPGGSPTTPASGPPPEAGNARTYADARSLAPAGTTIERLLARHAPRQRTETVEPGVALGESASRAAPRVLPPGFQGPPGSPRPGRGRVSPLPLLRPLEHFEDAARANLESWTRPDGPAPHGVRRQAGSPRWHERTLADRPTVGAPENARTRPLGEPPAPPLGTDGPITRTGLGESPSASGGARQLPSSPLENALARNRAGRSTSVGRQGQRASTESADPPILAPSPGDSADQLSLDRRDGGSHVPALLGRIAATLAGIEARLAEHPGNEWGPAAAPVEWFADDELALRLHRVLKRQAQRRGIDLS